MPLHVTKHERFSGADRTELALAALEFCRAVNEVEGVDHSRFYWIDPNEIAILVEDQPPRQGRHRDQRRALVGRCARQFLRRL